MTAKASAAMQVDLPSRLKGQDYRQRRYNGTVIGAIIATMDTPEQRQQQLLQALAAVPTGRVVTYGQLAELAGLPRYARLAGAALKKLPKDTNLPWHRVINAGGRISFPVDSDGYRRQRARLLDEGIEVQGNRVSLARYRWQP